MSLNLVPALPATRSRPCSCECGCRERVPRYPTDLTDAQWAALEPLLPAMLSQTALGGRPERHWRRTMVDAVLYLVDNGVKWRALPGDFPPWRTVYGLHARWRRDGVLADVADRLRAAVRTAEGRDPEPSAAIVDSQSVRESAEGVVPAATSGYDGHKKVNGRKRHLLVDTPGLLIAVAASPANVPDRHGAAVLLRRARRQGRRRLALAWGDRGYEGQDWVEWAQRELGIAVQVVRRDPRGRDPAFTRNLPRRWVVERTNAWISRRRRCARDYERLLEHHEAMVYWAAILQMTRRAAKTAAS